MPGRWLRREFATAFWTCRPMRPQLTKPPANWPIPCQRAWPCASRRSRAASNWRGRCAPCALACKPAPTRACAKWTLAAGRAWRGMRSRRLRCKPGPMISASTASAARKVPMRCWRVWVLCGTKTMATPIRFGLRMPVSHVPRVYWQVVCVCSRARISGLLKHRATGSGCKLVQ